MAGGRSTHLTAGPPDADGVVVSVPGDPGPAVDRRRLVAGTGASARAVAPDVPGRAVAVCRPVAGRRAVRPGWRG